MANVASCQSLWRSSHLKFWTVAAASDNHPGPSLLVVQKYNKNNEKMSPAVLLLSRHETCHLELFGCGCRVVLQSGQPHLKASRWVMENMCHWTKPSKQCMVALMWGEVFVWPVSFSLSFSIHLWIHLLLHLSNFLLYYKESFLYYLNGLVGSVWLSMSVFTIH